MVRKALRLVAAIVMVGSTTIAGADTPAPPPRLTPAGSRSATRRSSGSGGTRPERRRSAPAPVAKATPNADDSVVLNFEGADIREVIHSLADSLGINYQIDPRIQGQVTIRTTGPIAQGRPLPDLQPDPALERHLRGAGRRHLPDHPGRRGQDQGDHPGRARREAPGRRRGRLRDRGRPGRARGGAGDGERPAAVRHARAATSSRMRVRTCSIVTDLESNVARLKELVTTFDRDAFRDLRAKVYKIEHANIEEIGQELIAIMDTYGVTPASRRGARRLHHPAAAPELARDRRVQPDDLRRGRSLDEAARRPARGGRRALASTSTRSRTPRRPTSPRS